MEKLFSKEDFELLRNYGGKHCKDYPDARLLLKASYEKLGRVIDEIYNLKKYRTSIRRDPTNRGQKYSEYQWSQIWPKDIQAKLVYFVLDCTAEGLNLHIDCDQNYEGFKESGCYKTTLSSEIHEGSWNSIPVDDAVNLTLDDIVKWVMDYCSKNIKNLMVFGSELGVAECKNYLRKMKVEEYKELLLKTKNLILTGAPGTGKTYLAFEIAKSISKKEIGFVQFHPSYDYTDFVEGLRPINEDGKVGFKLTSGIFKEFCEKALGDPSEPYVFVIDEINRGDLSKIFGELFFAIEPNYRGENHPVITQYASMVEEPNAFDKKLGNVEKFGHFFVPENVYIIGTMNDIDRSVESMDFAMRRRFAWREIKASDNTGMLDCFGNKKEEIVARMNALNNAIYNENEHSGIEGLSSAYHIGGAYFKNLEQYDYQNNEEGAWKSLWDNHIKGLLYEYLRGTEDADKNLETLYNAYQLKEQSESDGQ